VSFIISDMLSVTNEPSMLSVILMEAVMLNVVAPCLNCQLNEARLKSHKQLNNFIAHLKIIR